MKAMRSYAVSSIGAATHGKGGGAMNHHRLSSDRRSGVARADPSDSAVKEGEWTIKLSSILLPTWADIPSVYGYAKQEKNFVLAVLILIICITHIIRAIKAESLRARALLLVERELQLRNGFHCASHTFVVGVPLLLLAHESCGAARHLQQLFIGYG